MSSVVFDGRTVAIPEAFVKFIIEHSVSDLGVYKGADHTFADPYLNPRFGTDWDAIYTIGQTDYHFDRDLCNQMVAQVSGTARRQSGPQWIPSPMRAITG